MNHLHINCIIPVHLQIHVRLAHDLDHTAEVLIHAAVQNAAEVEVEVRLDHRIEVDLVLVPHPNEIHTRAMPKLTRFVYDKLSWIALQIWFQIKCKSKCKENTYDIFVVQMQIILFIIFQHNKFV